MRWLILSHRWLGLFGSLLILLWFASGFVMMYVPFPRLSESERLASLATINFAQVRMSPAEARVRAKSMLATNLETTQTNAERKPDSLEIIRLVQPIDTPIYALRFQRAGWVGIKADSGERLAVNELDAARAIAAFAAAPAGGATKLIVDQWSVYPGLKPHRPLFAVDVADGGRHYVSSRTGELVRDTSSFERGWNWIGSVVHWIYVTPIRENGDLWHWVVVVLSGYTIVVALLGTVLGVIRIRKYDSGNWSPYRSWMRWHHLFGLFGALFVFTWLVSGLLSMNPGTVFARADLNQLSNLWRGATLDEGMLPSSAPTSTLATKEIEWRVFREGAITIARRSEGESRVQLEATNGNQSWRVDRSFVEARAMSLAPSQKIASIERLDEHDLYYYPRTRARPLPAWRIVLADEAQTWWHIDESTGELVNAMSRSNRVERWLYNGLHSWDFAPLLKHRPWSWDVPMLIAMTIGFVFSVTCVVIAWRRLLASKPQRSAQSRLRRNERNIGTHRL
jgi:uncharacterized iron-regulated membrane protein